MTWWLEGRHEGVPLWWRIAWPAAWLWEQATGLLREAARDVHLWWTIPDDAAFALTPEARRRLEQEARQGRP